MIKTRHLTDSFYTGSSLQKVQPSNLTPKTVAVDCNQGAAKIFTAAYLWKIQRRGENRIQRRTPLHDPKHSALCNGCMLITKY